MMVISWHMQSGVAAATLELELVMIDPERFQHHVNMTDFAFGSLISEIPQQ